MMDTRFFLLTLVIGAFGCVPEGGGASDISGTIGGTNFVVGSASADRGIDGTYVVTLADTAEFSCSASSGLPMNYLQIVVSDVDAEGTYDADGRVFFNVFENGVSDGEAATEGTVTIDDVSFFGIDGSIDASGPESYVSGYFSAEICG